MTEPPFDTPLPGAEADRKRYPEDVIDRYPTMLDDGVVQGISVWTLTVDGERYERTHEVDGERTGRNVVRAMIDIFRDVVADEVYMDFRPIEELPEQGPWRGPLRHFRVEHEPWQPFP